MSRTSGGNAPKNRFDRSMRAPSRSPITASTEEAAAACRDGSKAASATDRCKPSPVDNHGAHGWLLCRQPNMARAKRYERTRCPAPRRPRWRARDRVADRLSGWATSPPSPHHVPTVISAALRPLNPEKPCYIRLAQRLKALNESSHAARNPREVRTARTLARQCRFGRPPGEPREGQTEASASKARTVA